MEITQSAQAGSVESCDILVTLDPPDTGGITIDLTSDVLIQFGGAIKQAIRSALSDRGVSACKVTAVDKGALDYTIRARVDAAVERAVR